MKRLILFLWAMPLMGQYVAPQGFGSPISGGSLLQGEQFRQAADANSNLPIGTAFVTSSGTYTPTTCNVYTGQTTSHTVACGIYSSSSGAPSSLLCSVTTTGTFTVGFTTIGTLSGCGTLAANTLYYVASISSNNTNGEEGTSLSSSSTTVVGNCPSGYNPAGTALGGAFGSAQGSPVLPSSWGTNNTTTKCWSQYVSLTCVSACGPHTDEFLFINYEGGSNGVAPTATTLASSIKSETDGIKTITASGANETFCTSGQLHNLLTNITVNGSSLDGSGSLGLCYATDTGGAAHQATFSFAQTYANISFGWWFATTIPDADSASNRYSMDTFKSEDLASTTCNPQIIPTGSALTMALETNVGDAPGSITFSSGTTYNIQFHYQVTGGNTVCTLAMYDTTGAQVGSTLSETLTGKTDPFQLLEVGISGAESESSGFLIKRDDMQISVYGTFPLTH